MTSAAPSLKTHLEYLASIFAEAGKMKPDEKLELDARSAQTVLKTLRALSQQAGHLELERFLRVSMSSRGLMAIRS